MTDKRLNELNGLKERIDSIDEMLRVIGNNKQRLKPNVFTIIFDGIQRATLRFWYGCLKTEIHLTQDVLDEVEAALLHKRVALAAEFAKDDKEASHGPETD